MRVLVVTNMYPSAEEPHWGAFVRSQVDSLKSLGVDISVHEIDGRRSAWSYARALRGLPAIARRERVDLVHAHYGLSGAAAMRVRDVPLVVSFCGDDLLGRPDKDGRITRRSRLLVGLSKLAARRADAVIVKSKEMRRRIPDVEGVHVIPNGVDLDRFDARPREVARDLLGWPRDGSVLLFAGSPDEPRKNWPLASAVEARLKARGRDVRLVAVYGRSQDDVALAMSAADVLLLPSFHEGSPNVVKEAMAAALPVVAGPVGDCPERLEDCWPGAVTQLDADAFTAAVEAVLTTRQRSNGRDKVMPLELGTVARQVVAVYEGVLSGKRKIAADTARSEVSA